MKWYTYKGGEVLGPYDTQVEASRQALKPDGVPYPHVYTWPVHDDDVVKPKPELVLQVGKDVSAMISDSSIFPYQIPL